MRICALDLSKRSAGWAVWGPSDSKLASGAFVLGSEFTSKGSTYCKLHAELTGLNQVGRIDAIYWEDTIDARSLSGHTNIETLKVLGGLVAHAESWGEVMGCRVLRSVNQLTWRREFLGSIPRPKLKDKFGNRTGERPIDWKALAMERCQQLGFKTKTHDEAEAIGILDFACADQGIIPPWRENEVLRPALGIIR